MAEHALHPRRSGAARHPATRPLRRDAERGSVLMLMPAAVLVVIVLGGIAVDRAIVFGAQRDLVATAQVAANDGVAALDLDGLRTVGDVRVDEARLDRAVRAAAARADGDVAVRWELDGEVLVVHLERRVGLVFARGVPGAAPAQRVRATARSTLVRR